MDYRQAVDDGRAAAGSCRAASVGATAARDRRTCRAGHAPSCRAERASGIDLDLAVSHSTAYADGLTLVSTKATTVAVGPRVGFNLHLGESWSFYPRLTFGYRTTHVAQHEPVGGGQSQPEGARTSIAARTVVGGLHRR